jgi:hypothetical protein
MEMIIFLTVKIKKKEKEISKKKKEKIKQKKSEIFKTKKFFCFIMLFELWKNSPSEEVRFSFMEMQRRQRM